MDSLNDLVSSISSDSFSSDKLLTAESKKALHKCISKYEESKGEGLVRFADFIKDVYSYKEFIEKNKKYESIPKASKIYIYRYKNEDVLTVIIHKDGNKITLVNYILAGEYKKEKAYYITSACVSIGIGNPIIQSFVSKVKSIEREEIKSKDTKEKDDKKEDVKESVLYFDDIINEGANLDATKELCKPLQNAFKALVKVNGLIRSRKFDEARNLVNTALDSIKEAKSNIRNIRASDDNASTSIIGNALGILMNIAQLLVIWKPSFNKNKVNGSKFSKIVTKLRTALAVLSTAGTVASDIKQLKEEANQQKDNDEKKINLYIAKLLKYLTTVEVTVRSLNDAIDVEEEVEKIMSEMDSKEK